MRSKWNDSSSSSSLSSVLCVETTDSEDEEQEKNEGDEIDKAEDVVPRRVRHGSSRDEYDLFVCRRHRAEKFDDIVNVIRAWFVCCCRRR